MVPRLLTLLLLVLAFSIAGNAQMCLSSNRPDGLVPPQDVYGRIVVPIPGFQKTIEVLVFEHSRLVSYAYTNGNGEYRMREIPAGRNYEMVVRIDGFKEFHEKFDACDPDGIDLKRFRQAEAEFNKAMDLKPVSAVPLLALGSLYLQEIQAATSPTPGEPGTLVPEDDIPLILDDARNVLEKAVKIKPDAAFGHYLLGVIHHKSSAYGRSEESYKSALVLDPKLRWARLSLANLYLRLGRLKEVVEQLDIYLKDYPTMLNRFDVQEMRKRIAKLLPPEKK